MCGVIYYQSLKKKPVAGKVLKRYHQQRIRGHEGFGVYRPERDQMAHNTEEKDAIKHLRKLTDSVLLFHHRTPTSTENVRNACHPFSTKDYFKRNYVLIHNGMISNASYLRTKHEALGIKYVSNQPPTSTGWIKFNDSEALLWEVALYLEGKTDKMEASGSIAFICYSHESSQKAKLYYAHNERSPLLVSKGKNHFSIASTGDGKNVPEDMLYSYNYDNGQISSTKLPLATYYNSYQPPSGQPSTPPKTSPTVPASTTTPATVSTNPNRLKTLQEENTIEPYKSKPVQAKLPVGASGFPDAASLHAHHSVPAIIKPEKKIISHIPTEDYMSRRIKELVKHYLDTANGLYADAGMYLLNDLDEAEDTHNQEDYALLEAVYQCIEDDPYYINYASIHPEYLEWDKTDNAPSPAVKSKIGFHPDKADKDKQEGVK